MGVFDSMIGHGGAKTIMRSALRAGDVDILLEGPPASGKSVALLAIEEHVPGAMFSDAAGFTEREMRDVFAEDPSVLLLDELDAAKNNAYEAMSMPMEQNRVTKNTNNESYDKEVHTQVFAACNDASDLPAHTADRFRTIEFEEYTYDEYMDVCAILLPAEVEWVEAEDTARKVAESVFKSIDSKSPRDARDAAKLAGTEERIETIARALEDPKADVDSEPLDPSEIQRAQDHRGADGSGGTTNPTQNGAITEETFRKEACEHILNGANPAQMRSLGRFLCPDCAEKYNVSPRTKLSDAQA